MASSSSGGQLPSPQPKGFVLGEKLGAGSYGSVYKAWGTGPQRQVVAIKCVSRKKLSQTAADNLVTEIQLLQTLRHRFIVQLLDFLWDKHYVYLVLEYCSGGDLARLIRQKTRLSEATCQRFLRQLAVALRFLRSHEVAHLDLKPQNLLLQTISLQSSRAPNLKLGDFGFARLLSPEAQESTLRGSPLYMAPEMLLKRHYDASADLWSVGTLVFESLFGITPYPCKSISDLLKKLQANEPVQIPAGARISSDCRSLLMGLLQADPAKRMSFEDFFAHPFVDLKHFPSEESLNEGSRLVKEAVLIDGGGDDGEKDPAQALQLYCQALQFLIPILHDEEFSHMKASLQPQVDSYLSRATELQHQLGISQEGPSMQILTEREELWHLSQSTPTLLVGLEIGLSGEQYEVEGQLENALCKWELALTSLLPALRQEPQGTRRRELLHRQVRAWLEKAERTKAMLELHKAKENQLAETNPTSSCSLS